ncbi:hypothetical protein [uncultured Ruminococcus sp.]|uniref:hypothetical protein n=1 Tax=uncultured Ruminococcus sp. TaxID=165186 RepID=UPI002931ECF0|nr:hypothetical protein [uncultured Ruminococcus sp.]
MMFPKARKGVTKIFIAEIITLIVGVLSGILTVIITKAGGIENFSFEGAMNSSAKTVLICSIAAAALLLLSGLLKIIGYIQAAGDEEYFTRAIIYAVIGVVLYVIAGFLQNKTGVVMEWIYTIVIAIAELMQLLVMTSTVNGLAELSYRCRRDDLESRGSTINKIVGTVFSLNIALVIAGRLLRLFMSENVVDTITMIVTIIIVILTIIAYILYLGYLGKVSSMLRRN